MFWGSCNWFSLVSQMLSVDFIFLMERDSECSRCMSFTCKQENGLDRWVRLCLQVLIRARVRCWNSFMFCQ
jgi:hypothetical protein